MKKVWSGIYTLLIIIVASSGGVLVKNYLSYQSNQQAFISSCVTAGTTEQRCGCYFSKLIEKYNINGFISRNKEYIEDNNSPISLEYRKSLEDVYQQCK